MVTLPLNVGTSVLLVDGRGCHRIHVIARGDVVTDESLRLAGVMWRSLAFRFTGDVDFAQRPIGRCADPAIGPADDRFRAIYLPAGWAAPDTRRTRAL